MDYNGGFFISTSKSNDKLVRLSNTPVSDDDTDFQGFSISLTVSKIKELIRKLGLKPPKLKKAELLQFLIGNAQQPEERTERKTKPKAKPKAEPKAEPKAKTKAEPKEPKAKPKAEPKSEPKAEPKVEPKAEPKAEKKKPSPIITKKEDLIDSIRKKQKEGKTTKSSYKQKEPNSAELRTASLIRGEKVKELSDEEKALRYVAKEWGRLRDGEEYYLPLQGLDDDLGEPMIQFIRTAAKTGKKITSGEVFNVDKFSRKLIKELVKRQPFSTIDKGIRVILDKERANYDKDSLASYLKWASLFGETEKLKKEMKSKSKDEPEVLRDIMTAVVIDKPKAKTSPKKEVEYYPFSFSVKTKRKISPDAFNFSRDFKYKTIKTDSGFNFIFNNKKDLDTGIDMSMYSMDFKNPKLYQWNYEKVQKSTEEKQKQKPTEEKTKQKPTEEKQKPTDETEFIVQNWDEPYIANLLYQTNKYRPFIEYIDKLINKGKAIHNSALFFDSKELLNKLNEKYDLKKIDDVMTYIVEGLGGKSIMDDNKGYFKYLNTKNRRKKEEKS